MKTGTVLIGLGLAAGAYYLSQLGVATNTVQVIFNGVRILGITNYEITLTVQNLSNVSVTVNAMSGNVFLNGEQLGNFSDFNAVTVPARGQQNIQVTLSPNILQIPSVVQAILAQHGKKYNFHIEGNVNLNGLVVPLEVDEQFAV